MEKFTISAAAFVLMLCSCNPQSNDSQTEQKDQEDTAQTEKSFLPDTEPTHPEDYGDIIGYLVEPVEDTSLVQRVEENSAILIFPPTEHYEKSRKQLGDEEFYKGANEKKQQVQDLLSFLDSLDINTIKTEKRNLAFVGEEEEFSINLDPEHFKADTVMWGAMLFNPKKPPIMIDIKDPDREKIKRYLDLDE